MSGALAEEERTLRDPERRQYDNSGWDRCDESVPQGMSRIAGHQQKLEARLGMFSSSDPPEEPTLLTP